MLEVHQNRGLLFFEDQEALLPYHPQKGKIHFHLKTKTPALLRALRKPYQSDNQHAFVGSCFEVGNLN